VCRVGAPTCTCVDCVQTRRQSSVCRVGAPSCTCVDCVQTRRQSSLCRVGTPSCTCVDCVQTRRQSSVCCASAPSCTSSVTLNISKRHTFVTSHTFVNRVDDGFGSILTKSNTGMICLYTCVWFRKLVIQVSAIISQ